MVAFSATLTESNSKLFDARSRDSLVHLSKVEIGKVLHERGRQAVAGVRARYQQHNNTGELLKRIDWKAPYRSIPESKFASYRRDSLFTAIGIYDRPGDTRETGARAYIARFIERGTKHRFTRKSAAYRGRVRAHNHLEKGAKLSKEEVKITRAIRRAERRALSRRRRRTYKLT